jgi:preprotein translocase subunit SecE
MARQTRAQRRARRAQMTGGEAAIPGGPPAPPQRRPTARAGAQPEPAREPRRESRGGVARFVAESWAELKKVEWPGRSQVIQGTIVVIIACVIVGVYLYAADQLFKPFVRNVLLGE